MPTPINRVVVLMMENHSFDRVLGWTKQHYPDIEGVDPDRQERIPIIRQRLAPYSGGNPQPKHRQ